MYHTMWAFVCPVLSVSLMAWAFRRSANRRCVCCGEMDDVVPGEIVIVNKEADSVIGDRSTDVELMPVSTMRSRSWTDCGADPVADIPVKESFDWSVEEGSAARFTRMVD